jgi:hypothetical protein
MLYHCCTYGKFLKLKQPQTAAAIGSEIGSRTRDLRVMNPAL